MMRGLTACLHTFPDSAAISSASHASYTDVPTTDHVDYTGCMLIDRPLYGEREVLYGEIPEYPRAEHYRGLDGYQDVA